MITLDNILILLKATRFQIEEDPKKAFLFYFHQVNHCIVNMEIGDTESRVIILADHHFELLTTMDAGNIKEHLNGDVITDKLATNIVYFHMKY